MQEKKPPSPKKGPEKPVKLQESKLYIKKEIRRSICIINFSCMYFRTITKFSKKKMISFFGV